jgi:hypothetical protein
MGEFFSLCSEARLKKPGMEGKPWIDHTGGFYHKGHEGTQRTRRNMKRLPKLPVLPKIAESEKQRANPGNNILH